jgi:hypothetical protein
VERVFQADVSLKRIRAPGSSRRESRDLSRRFAFKCSNRHTRSMPAHFAQMTEASTRSSRSSTSFALHVVLDARVAHTRVARDRDRCDRWVWCSALLIQSISARVAPLGPVAKAAADAITGDHRAPRRVTRSANWSTQSGAAARLEDIIRGIRAASSLWLRHREIAQGNLT